MFLIQVNGQQQGPFTVEQLKAGGITPTMMVWCQGMPGWAAAGTVPQLAPLFAPAPAAPTVFAPPPAFAPAPYAPPAQPAVAAAGVFAGIEGARASGDSNYIRPGTYWFQVVRAKVGRSQLKGEFFALELRAVRVLDDGRMDPGGSRPHFIGEECSHMMMRQHASFLGNVKAAIGGILEIPADQVDAQVTQSVMTDVTSDKQPLANMFVEVYAHTIMTRGGNGKPPAPFTKVAYKRRIAAIDVKQAITAVDPSGATEARLFPQGMLDRIVAYESSRGITSRAGAPAPAATTGVPAFGGGAPAQPPAPPAWGAPPAAPAAPTWAPPPGAPPAPQFGAMPGAPPTTHNPSPSIPAWAPPPGAAPPAAPAPSWNPPAAPAAPQPSASPAFMPGPAPGPFRQ